MDPLQDAAEAISQADGTSLQTCLRNGTKCFTAVRSEEKIVRNNPADTKVKEEGVEGVGSDIPLQPVGKTKVRQVASVQPKVDSTRADVYPAAYGGRYTGVGEDFLKEAALCGELTL